MPQYTTGTARVLSAAPQRVELVGATTTNQLLPGDLFKFQADIAPTWFTIGSIVSATLFDLTGPYTGSQAFDTLLPYVAVRDFTPNFSIPELAPGDIAIRDVYTQAMRIIDGLLGGNMRAEFSFVGAITVGDKAFRWYPPRASNVQSVAIMVGTAPSGANLIVTVKKNGTNIFTTAANRPAIIPGNFFALSGAPDIKALAITDFLTVEVVQVGSGVPGSDLVVQVRF
jgi:hypothetical protein